jgi:hypothetical protein
MLIGLLWIAGIYVFSLVLIHTVYGFQRKEFQRTYFVFITKNNQAHIEWYLRSLQFFSWFRGRSIVITIFDEGSTDETIPIALKIAKESNFMDVYESTGTMDAFIKNHQDDSMILLELSQLEPHTKLTQLHW